jgi:hypothetical protein
MLTVEGTGYNLKLNDYWLHPESKSKSKSKSKWGVPFFRSVHINVKKRCYKREDNNVNLSGVFNTERKKFGRRAEENHTVTVCVLFLYSIVRKNITVH